MPDQITKRIDWHRRVPIAAMPWWRRVAVDFKEQIPVRCALGRCALLGACDYNDITPKMIDDLFREYGNERNMRHNLRLFSISPFCPAETREYLEKNYKIENRTTERITWDSIFCDLPYKQRQLAMFLCDNWRRVRGGTQHRLRPAKQGIAAALRFSGVYDISQLKDQNTVEAIKIHILGNPNIENKEEACEETLQAIEIATRYNPSWVVYDKKTDPLFFLWFEEQQKSERFKSLSQTSQKRIKKWGRRVIPPRAKRWTEITFERVREVIRQIRTTERTAARTRTEDAAIRQVLLSMPLTRDIDLTKFWEPRFFKKNSEIEFCSIPQGAILPSGELDPRYFKEEKMLDFSITSNGNNHIDEGLANQCHTSQRMLIREQAQWAAEHPGLFRARSNECYTQHTKEIITELCDTSSEQESLRKDIARCAFCRILLALDGVVTEEDDDTLKVISKIINDAVSDASQNRK